MEKYIIIFVILATIYYIQTKLKETEGFADVPAQSLGGVDDTNSINTLAQISKQLMAGGITVPGNINIKDGILDIKPPGDWGLALSVTGGVKEAPYINFNNKADGKRNGFIMGSPDKFILGNNVQVAGALSVDTTLSVGGSINLGGDITFLAPKTIIGKARLHITGEEYLYILNKTGVMIGKEWGGNGSLTVQGDLSVGGNFRPVLSEIFRITNQYWKYVLFSSDGNAVNCNGNGNFDMTWQNNPEYFWFQRGSRIYNYKYPNKCMTITGDRGWNRDTFVNLTDFDPNNAYQSWTWSWSGCIVTSSCSNGEGNPIPGLKNGWITKMRCRQDGRIDIWDWGGGADTQFWKW